MSQVRKFADVDEFREAASAVEFDVAVPYLIEDCPTLKALAEAPIAKTAFTTFRAQLSKSEQVKAKKKAQCPYQARPPTQAECARLCWS